MAEVTVHIAGYSTGTSEREPGIVVENYEGDVHINLRQIDDVPAGTARMTPEEARALAAALLHAAFDEEGFR